MKQIQRWKEIVSILQNDGSLSAEELAEKLDVSIATIRRDLVQLNKDQAIVRTWGGAKVKIEETEEPDMKAKTFRNSLAKETIAKYAASLIQDRMTVCIDSGSTNILMIKYITAKDIIVVTNGLLQVQQLAEKNIRSFILPGEIKANTLASIGEKTLEALDLFNFDICFIGSNGVDSKTGFSTHEVNEAEVKRRMLQKSRQRYIVADSSKFNHSYFVSFCSINDATLITEKRVDDFDYSQCNCIVLDENTEKEDRS